MRLAFFRTTPYARSLASRPRKLFVTSLTTLLHDMGKLSSPRDKAGHQLPDPTHPRRSRDYALRHGRTLGLTPAEANWMARMMEAHEALGMTDRYDRVPGAMTTLERDRFLSELMHATHTVDDLNYLEAFTESDVWGANGRAYSEWQMNTRIPALARRLARELALPH
jgi:hypothetical protein